MNEDNFNKIEKILKEEGSNAGGPLTVSNIPGGPLIDFDNIVEAPEGKDMIIHVKYFPEENRYGFAIYNKEEQK